MKESAWRDRLLDSTRGRILQRLREREQTVNDLAHDLNLTDNAVRAHLVSLERDGLIRQSGTLPGVRKPHVLYRVTDQSEQIFPKAYGTLLDLVLAVFEKKLSPQEMRASLRVVGRQVAALHREKLSGNSRPRRIEAALKILEELGGSARLEETEHGDVIRGNGCPLAAATARHPEACFIAEALLTQVIGAPVRQRCDHDNGRPSCRFEIASPRAQR